MLNKKILAAAIAAAMSNVAVAAVDLDAAAPVAANYAQELAWGQNPVLVENLEGTPTYVTTEVGFTISEGTSKYLRYDLEGGATFAAQPTLSFSNLGTSQPQATVAVGGDGESFVIFELTAFEDQPLVNEDIASDLQVELQVAAYNLPTDVDTIVHYRLYEDAVDAFKLGNASLTDTSETLKNESAVLATFGAGVTGEFANENDNTASVDTEFTRFLGDAAAVDSVVAWDGASVSAETANVGEVDVDLLARTGFFNLDGGVLDGADIVGADPVLTFNGDFSFGTWTVHEIATTAAAACADGTTETSRTYTMNTAMDTITMSFAGDQTVLETTDYALCVDVSNLDPTRDDVIVDNGSGAEQPYANNRIRKGNYTTTLVWDTVTPSATYDWDQTDGGMGSPYTDGLGYIHYDTITVEVPYLTNLSDYNQRVVIVNDGPTDASYVVEFIAEEGFTATGGSQASGSVAAGTTRILRGSNILDNVTNGVATRTRSAAKLYIDGKDDDIQVMIQTVNMNTGATDTEVLNANSVVGETTNYLNEKTPSNLD